MTHLEALEKALWLAITAPTKKKSTMALELANDLAYGISREELEVIKAGIEKRVSLIQKKRIYECDYEECSKLFLSDEEHGVGRPTTTCSLEHRNKQKTIAATLRKRKLRQKNKLASVRKDFQ